MRVFSVFGSLLCLVFLSGCGGQRTESSRDRQGSASETSSATRWVHPEMLTDNAVLELSAETTGTSGEGVVSVAFASRVVSVLVRAGDRVTAGQVLLEVVSSEVLAAAAVLSSSRAQRTLRTERRARLSDLRDEGLIDSARLMEQDLAISDIARDEASALAVLQSAGLRASEAPQVLRRGRFVLRSPLPGVVLSVPIRLGELRNPADGPLVTIVGGSSDRVSASVAQPIRDFTGLEAVFVSTSGAESVLRLPPHESVLDARSGQYRLFLDPVDGISVPPGTTGVVRILDRRPHVFSIPLTAIVRSDTGSSLLARTTGEARAQGDTRRLPLTILYADRTRAVVLVPGLSVTDLIAASAAPAQPIEGSLD